MSVRKILNAAAGYADSIASASAPSDTYFDSTSLLLTGDVEVDPSFANVSLLIDGNTIADKSNNKLTITNTGTVTVSNTIKQFGTGSMYFSGSNYLSIPHSTGQEFGSGNFTIEFWCYQSTFPVTSHWVSQWNSTTGYNFAVYNVNGELRFAYTTNGSTVNALSSTYTLTTGTWSHIAVVRNNASLLFFVNGNLKATTSISGTLYSGTGALEVGRNGDNTQFYNGYIDDLRITKGVVRYTANFTPPVKALPTYEILDSSVYRLPVTAYGNARIDTATKKYGTGSMYFDGSGDYLKTPTLTSTSLIDTSANYTVEGWLYVTGAPPAGYGNVFVINGDGTGQTGISVWINNNTIQFWNSGYVTQWGVSSTISLNTWYHFAYVKNGATLTGYVNGTSIGTSTSTTANGTSNCLYMGAGVSGVSWNGDYPYLGYIDDFRITKGYARYTQNFTPPSTSLPTIPPTVPADPWWGNVSLLLDGNTTDAYDPYWQNVSLMLTGDDFIDWSNNHLAISNTNITRSTTIKKYGTSSLAFNGVSGNALSITSPGTTNSIGAGDFTVEAWAYYLDIAGWRDIICFVGNPVSWGITTSGGDLGAYGIGIDYSGTIVPINQWFHVAVTRQSGTVRLFLNGGLVTSATNTTSFTNTQINIGSWVSTSSENLNGYIAELRVTKGVARYTANFTPPTAALPAFKIQDRTQNALTLTPYGNVQLSTDVMKNGTGSMFFDGVGDNVSIANTPYLTLGTSDFTIEGWFNQSSTLPYAHIFTTTSSYGTANNLRMTISGGVFNVYTSNAGLITPAGSVTNGTWYHFALVRTGTTLTLYSNGVSIGTATTSVSFIMDTFMVGGEGTYPFNGYIDDFRVTKGYARYTQNFTPPSQSFATQYISTGYDPNYADVSLLLNGNGTNGSTTFTDLSSSPKTITTYGNSLVSTSVKKYGTGSIYFDNSGNNYLQYQDNVGFGSNDFTIEFWYNTPTGFGTGTFNGVQSGLLTLCCTKTVNIAGFSINDNFVVYMSTDGVTYQYMWDCPAVTTNTWTHLAFVRNGSNFYIFQNGTLFSTHTMSGSLATLGGDCIIGKKIAGGLASTGFTVYMDDLRITKGVARYTTNFTPPTYQLPTDTTGTAIDPLRASTSLLLRGNGTNGSTSFTDESPNGLTVTNNGSVTVNTTTKKFGTGSMYFNGSANLYSNTAVSANDLSGDYTIEFWANITDVTASYHRIISLHYPPLAGDTPTGFFYLYNNGSALYIYTTSVGTLVNLGTFTANTWFHCALARSGSTFTVYINGVSTYTKASATGTIPWGGFCIGGSVSEWMTGYIDDFRVTKGYARYTANFTPPTYEDPIVTGTVLDYNYPQVSLLLNGDGTNGSTTFTDLSSRPKTITAYGNAQISTTQKKFGTGSMYFDGAGDYLTAPITEFQLGTTDFTIEAWIYSNDITTYKNICGSWVSGAYSFIFDTWANGYLHFKINSNTEMLIASTAIATGTWYHVAVSRSGSSFYMFLNGVSVATTSNSNAIVAATAPLAIGANADTAYGQNWNGYIDDLRITKGIARYTQNFTPPTAPLPTSYS